MRFLVIVAVIIGIIVPARVYAGGADIARSAAACYQHSAAVLGRQARESGKAQQDINKLGTNYPALCEYGRTVGTPLLERHLVEQEAQRNSGCWDDINESVLAASKKTLASYKKEVVDDCKKAGQASAKTEGGSGCVVETKAYENGGRRSDNIKEFEKLECVKVANKCGFRIEFSVTVTGSSRSHRLSNSAESGGVGKICGSNERESLSYSGWKKWGTTEPLRQ